MSIKEKRKSIRLFALSLQICPYCFFHESETGIQSCKRCKGYQVTAKQKQRDNPLNCSRCGCKKDNKDYKTCNNCRKK